MKQLFALRELALSQGGLSLIYVNRFILLCNRRHNAAAFCAGKLNDRYGLTA